MSPLVRGAARALEAANLALRFGLELAALVALGAWGWLAHESPWRLVLAIALPMVAAAAWGTFRIPGDPKPSPPVPVRGRIRLPIELAVMFVPVALIEPYWPATAHVQAVLLVLHYTAGGRLVFLVKHF